MAYGDDPTRLPPPGVPQVNLMYPPRPERTQRSDWSRQTTKETMDPNALEAMSRAEAAQAEAQAARRREAEAAAEAGRRAAEEEEKQAAEKEAFLRRENELRTQREQGRAQLNAALDDDVKQLAADAKPTDFWEDRGAPAKVLSAFLVGLGGFAAGPNNRNSAMDILQDAMARDRQLKMDRFQNRKDIVALRRTNLDAYNAETERMAGLLAKQDAVKGEIMARQAGAIAKRMGIPEAQAKAEAIRAASQQQWEMYKQGEYAKLNQKTVENRGGSVTVNDPGKPTGGAVGGIFGPGGKPIASTGDPKKDATVNEGIKEYRQLRDIMSRLRENYKQGRVLPGTDAAEERKAMASEAKVLYNSMKAKLGALSGPDAKLIEGVVGSGDAFLYTGDPGVRVDKGLEGLDRGVAKNLDSFGLPGKQILPMLNEPPEGASVQQQAPAQAAPAPAPRSRGAGPETKKLANGKTAVRVGNTWKIQD